jgi:hypothetical protein
MRGHVTLNVFRLTPHLVPATRAGKMYRHDKEEADRRPLRVPTKATLLRTFGFMLRISTAEDKNKTREDGI